MKSFLFIVAVISFFFLCLAVLFENLPFFLSLQVKGDPVTYVFTIVSNLTSSIQSDLPYALIPTVLLLLVVILNLGNEITFRQNKIAIALLFLICTIFGVVFNLLILLTDSYLLRRGLPGGFAYLLIDTLIVLVPSVLLLLCLLGYDFRKLFLISLLPIIIISYVLKAYYFLAGF